VIITFSLAIWTPTRALHGVTLIGPVDPA